MNFWFVSWDQIQTLLNVDTGIVRKYPNIIGNSKTLVKALWITRTYVLNCATPYIWWMVDPLLHVKVKVIVVEHTVLLRCICSPSGVVTRRCCSKMILAKSAGEKSMSSAILTRTLLPPFLSSSWYLCKNDHVNHCFKTFNLDCYC